MADENIVTNIVAKSDFSNLIADLHKVSYSLTSLQDKLIATNKTLASQVGVMNRSFAETLRSTGQYSTRFVSLTSDVDKFGNQLEKGQMKLSKFFNVYGQHAKTSGGLIRDLARQQVQLQNAIMQPLGKNAEGLMQYNVHIPRGLDAVKNKTAIARQELQIMNKVVQEGAGQLINWGKNTQWAGRQLTVGLTVPLVAFGKASADAFKQADEQLVRLTKVYGGVAQTSAADLAKIRAEVSKTASDLSKSYGSSFKDTLSLAADIAATGKQGDDLLGSLRETTRLSVLGEVDKQDAMKATLAIQSAFKQNTEELTQSINFLNAVENQTSTTLNDLVEAIPKAGPIIKGLGGSIQDLALYLTAMREGGINASEGANALKSGLASLINPTKVAKGMFQDFGISLENIVNKNTGNTTATLLELQAALETLNPLQKQQALEQLFGKFQFARMNALFENLGKQGSQTLQVMDLMKASSQDLASLASRELGQVTESASGKYRRAVEGLRADLAGIGNQFLSINTNLINFVDGVIKFVQQLPGPIKQALGFFGMLTAVAGPLIMLTGVLGNFFGYIIKGAYHFKSLFRGGEGWKLLTPEILAAQKAGALVETTFYSDAKAATVLKQSINELALSYANLQEKASMAATSTNPAVRTAAGNLIIPSGGQRQVDPNHPMTGKRDTRDFSHINPVGQMTPAQKQNQTIFGVVPGSEGVNARISNNPQMYMNKDMPKIPGLTTINGASTGIVAAEAAKWHSMTGALAMQSQAEIKLLKAEVAQTGLITHELSASYQALLPEMTRLTTRAATESAAIVSRLQAGKLTVDAAMVEIRTLNAQIEAMMGQAATQVAASQGRNINLTGVPLLNQAVVGPNGKSNFKELSRPGRTRGLLSTIARNLGVKTYGAGYSMETTIPKKMAYGGSVPGSGNTDTVPAMLTPGEFVVNKEATAANLSLLQAINGPGGNGPGYNLGSKAEVRGDIQSIYAGREISHLGSSYSAASRPRAHAKLMQNYNVTQAQLNDPRTAVHGGLTAAYHKFFNQGTARGSLPISVAIDYLNGRPIPVDANGLYNPNSKTIVKHNPEIAYRALMHDLGIRERSRAGFAADLDGQIIQDLIKEQRSGKTILSDRIAGKNAAQRASASLIGQSVGNVVYKGGPGSVVSGGWGNSAIRNLRSLNQDQEIRVRQNDPLDGLPRKRGVSNNRIFRNVESRASSGLAAYSAGRGIPALAGKALNFISGLSRVKRKNMGGIIGMNAGGMVPGNQYLENGGQAQSSPSRYQGSMMAGMGLQTAGLMTGNTPLMLGGTAMQMAPMFAQLTPGIAKVKTLGDVLKGLGSILSKVGVLAVNAFKFLTGPIGLTIAAITTLATIALKLKDRMTQLGEANRLAFGGTKESFVSVGILKYKSLTDRLKEVNEQMDLNKAKAQTLYESYTKGGPTGITLSITELNAAIENAKKNQTEYIKAFNNIDSSGVNKYAADLKAQFVAMGLSASEASNQIYAMIKASEKSGQALSAVSTTDFRNIIDQTSALTRLFDNLGKASTLNNFNPEEFAVGLDTLINSVITYQQGLIGTKDEFKNIIDSADSLQITMKKITNIQSSQVILSSDQTNKLKEQNVIYASILGNLETTASITAKILLYNNQLGDVISLSAMSGQDAIDFAKNLAEVQNGVNAITEDVSQGTKNPLLFLAKPINDATEATENYAKSIKAAQKQDEDFYKNKIKAIDLEIKKINEAADAKIKALNVQQDAENIALEIKKAQLDYQDKLAAGDMSGAAQAQLNIQRLVKEKQTKDAMNSIEDKRKADLAIENAKKEKLQNEEDKFNKNLKTSMAKSAEQTANLANLQSIRDEIERLTLSSRAIGADQESIKKQIADKLNPLKTGTSGEKKLYAEYEKQYGGGGYQTGSSLNGPLGMASKLLSDMNLSFNNKGLSDEKFKTAIDTFDAAVKTFAGKTDLSNIKGDYGSLNYNKLDPRTWQNTDNIAKLIKDYSLSKGDEFTYQGKKYVVDNTNGPVKKLKEIKKAMGGYIKNYDTGSFGGVRGPGTGTSDSIPAYLSNGEYVLRASAVRAMGVPMLDEINKMAMGGLAARYDVGNKMSMPSSAMGYASGGMIQHYNVGGLTINTQPGQSEMEIARMAVNMMDAKNILNNTKRGIR